MTLQLQDKPSIALTATIANEELRLTFKEPLSHDDNSIFHTLNRISQADLSIQDFEHEGQSYAVHAWEILSSEGHLSPPWPRANGRVHSGMRGDMNARVLLIAAPGDLIPEPPSAQAPPPPTTSSTVLTVKVRKQGSMPGD